MDNNVDKAILANAVEDGLKRNEEMLNRQTGLFSSLLRNLPIGVFMVEAPTGKPLVANEAALQLLGRGILPDASRQNLAEVYKARRLGSQEPYPVDEMPIVLGMHGKAAHVDDLVVRRPDGTETLLEIFGSPVMDEKGQIWASLVSFFDITERKRSEAALKEIERVKSELIEKLNEAQHVAKVGSWEWNLLTNKVWWSDESYRIFGVTAKDYVPSFETNSRFIHPEDLTKYEDSFKYCMQTGDPLDTDLRLNTRDGVIKYCNTKARIVKDESGKPVRFVGTIMDITERKHEEEARLKLEAQLQQAQKLESLGILAGGIAHDFNNLMSGLFGYIEMARYSAEAKAGEKMVSNLDKAMGALERAKALTKQLLTFSKGGTPAKKLTNISELLRDAASVSLSGSSVVANFDIPPNLWPCEVERNQIIQAVDNILINAKEVMPNGGTISIAAVNLPPKSQLPEILIPGPHVRISIKDDGPGISTTHIARLFEPFFTTKDKGHGLGLPMAYSIIRKHGGLIVAESTPGQGATFHIYLPASLEGLMTEPTDVKVEVPRGKGKILIMDDEPAILEIVSAMLEDNGYLVESARNGDEAIQIYQKELNGAEPFLAVILDLTVRGGMGGKDTFKKLLEIDPGVTTLVSSGYSNDPLMTNPKLYGLKGAIMKPFRATELAQLLNQVLSENERKK